MGKYIMLDTRVHKITCARLGKPGPTGFKACNCHKAKRKVRIVKITTQMLKGEQCICGQCHIDQP